MLQNLLDIEKSTQKRLPTTFQNNDVINNLVREIDALDLRRQHIVSCNLFGELLVVQCGRFIKFCPLDPSMFAEQINSSNEFKDIAIDFDESIEIAKIWDTKLPNVLQIVAKDNKQNIFMVLTWDFDKNIEYSVLQIKCPEEIKAEKYVVRGMNQKLNYFVNQYRIFDLEYNIPL